MEIITEEAESEGEASEEEESAPSAPAISSSPPMNFPQPSHSSQMISVVANASASPSSSLDPLTPSPSSTPSKKKRVREETDSETVTTIRLFSALVRLRETLTRDRGGSDIALLSNEALILFAKTQPRSVTELNAIETLSCLPQDLKTALLEWHSLLAQERENCAPLESAGERDSLADVRRRPTPHRLEFWREFELRGRSIEEIAQTKRVQAS